MENKNNLEFTIVLDYIFNREEFLENLLYETGNHYFQKAEAVEDTYLKSIILQIVCVGMGEGFNFLSKLTQYKNLNTIKLMEQENIKRIFKLTALYTYFLFSEDMDMQSDQKEKLWEAITYTFAFDKQEKKESKKLKNIFENSILEFELEINNYTYRSLIRDSVFNPVIIALTSNLLYNSYSGFLENFERYIKIRQLA